MATILPPGETTFFDGNGDPLAGGTVTFYIPNSTTPKDTYRNQNQTLLNTNPVTLDSAGRAIIFGSGSYRQVVEDSLGNIIWDRTTAEPNAGITSSGGTSGGTANAQTLSGGTFDGSDGSTIQFTAGLTNTGPMTVSVGGSAPIAVLKNSSTGPVPLAANDVVAGNIYSIAYSSVLAAFQLLTSIPAVLVYANQATAEALTSTTDVMTPLRTQQAMHQPRADLASASTTDLSSLTTQNIRVTGTTTITSFGVAAAGTEKVLTFAGSLILTYNATSLILPSGTQSVVTAPGDSAVALSLGSGNWIVTSYKRRAPFISTPQAITVAGALTLAHGLGAEPSFVTAELVCSTADAGYIPDDRVFINPNAQAFGTASFGTSIVPDVSNLNVRYGSQNPVYAVLHKATGAATGITISSWGLVLRAYP